MPECALGDPSIACTGLAGMGAGSPRLAGSQGVGDVAPSPQQLLMMRVLHSRAGSFCLHVSGPQLGQQAALSSLFSNEEAVPEAPVLLPKDSWASSWLSTM